MPENIVRLKSIWRFEIILDIITSKELEHEYVFEFEDGPYKGSSGKPLIHKQEQFREEIKKLHNRGCEIVKFQTYYSGDINWLPQAICREQSIKPKWVVTQGLSSMQIVIRYKVVDLVKLVKSAVS